MKSSIGSIFRNRWKATVHASDSDKTIERRIQIDGISYYAIHSTCDDASKNNPPILLVYVLMANHHMWDSTVLTLNRAGYNTLQVDNIGHNQTIAPSNFESSMKQPAFHFDTMTEHLHSIVQYVTGQDKVEAVIGCSMGGALTLRYGLLFPSSVKNCLTCCDAPGATSLEIAKQKWTDRIDAFRRDLAESTHLLVNATVQRWLPGDDDESVGARAKALGMVKTCSFDGYRICADGIRSYDYEGLLGELKVRTLVLAGRSDDAIGPPEVTESIANAIPGAELLWMENTGPLPALHRPLQFESVVLEFLERPS